MSTKRLVSATKRKAIIISHNFTCGLTGFKEGDFYPNTHFPIKLHVDHIVPLSHGGSNDFKNLIPLWAALNFAKGKNRLDPKDEKLLLLKAGNAFVRTNAIYQRLSHQKIDLNKNPNLISLNTNFEKVLFASTRGTWSNIEKVIYLVKQYIIRGSDSLKNIAEEIGTSLTSVIAKLVQIGIYDKYYYGKTNV